MRLTHFAVRLVQSHGFLVVCFWFSEKLTGKKARERGCLSCFLPLLMQRCKPAREEARSGDKEGFLAKRMRKQDQEFTGWGNLQAQARHGAQDLYFFFFLYEREKE